MGESVGESQVAVQARRPRELRGGWEYGDILGFIGEKRGGGGCNAIASIGSYSLGDTQGISPHLLGLRHGIEGLQHDEVL